MFWMIRVNFVENLEILIRRIRSLLMEEVDKLFGIYFFSSGRVGSFIKSGISLGKGILFISLFS